MISGSRLHPQFSTINEKQKGQHFYCSSFRHSNFLAVLPRIEEMLRLFRCNGILGERKLSL
jgi:hypothetical protein